METPPPTVEQRHRDAAAPLIEMLGWQELADLIRAGDRDANPMVQAFARFDTTRTAELERQPERQNAAVREALVAILDAWDSIDEPFTPQMPRLYRRARNALGGQP